MKFTFTCTKHQVALDGYPEFFRDQDQLVLDLSEMYCPLAGSKPLDCTYKAEVDSLTKEWKEE